MKKMSLLAIIAGILGLYFLGPFASISFGKDKPSTTEQSHPQPQLSCPGEPYECRVRNYGLVDLILNGERLQFSGSSAKIGSVHIRGEYIDVVNKQNVRKFRITRATGGIDMGGGIAMDGTLKIRSANGQIITPILTITGGNDIAEPFKIIHKHAIKPGMVVSIDTEKIGQLRVSDRAYDRAVAGIVSGANGINPGLTMRQAGTLADGDFPVALTGRVYTWANASNGPIAPGDLLTTSDIPGHAMKVTDYDKAQGAVIGKAMTGLKRGKGLVLVLISLQ